MIYRLAEPAEWHRAQHTGVFVSADLAAEGFIHCSERHQIGQTAQKHFAGITGLILLEISESVLGETLVRENLTGTGFFPHIYGPIPLRAIHGYIEFNPAIATDQYLTDLKFCTVHPINTD